MVTYPDRRRLMAGLLAASGMANAAWSGVPPRIYNIPFTTTRARRLVIAVSIGGKGPFRFLMDTGGATSFIHDSLARRLKLENQGADRFNGVGGGMWTSTYAARDVVFGGQFRVPVMAMSGLSDSVMASMDGALAAGFLTAVPSLADFEARQISLYPDGVALPDLNGYALVSAERESGGFVSERLFVTVMVNREPARCLLDTGAPSALHLSSAYVRKHGLWDRNPQFENRRSGGISGDSVATRFTHLDSLSIGGFAIAGAPVTLSDPTRDDNIGHDGIVGMGVIARFNLAFMKDGLYLKPNRYFNDVAPLFGA